MNIKLLLFLVLVLIIYLFKKCPSNVEGLKNGVCLDRCRVDGSFGPSSDRKKCNVDCCTQKGLRSCKWTSNDTECYHGIWSLKR